MKKILNIITLSVAMTGALAFALPAAAQDVSVSASANVSAQAPVPVRAGIQARASSTRPYTGERAAFAASTSAAREAHAKDRANTEIDNRISALNALNARVGSMVRVSDSEKANISAGLQSEISNLSSLKTTVDGDTGTTSLRGDMQSITKAYRIYALVVPQGAIVAAADRIGTIVTSFTTISAKIQTRITAAQSAGVDVSTWTSTLADFNAKVSDAGVQASAATAEVANLTPDNGDQTILAANTAALKDARSKIQAATQDLQAARQDAETIIKAIQSLKINTTASTTVSQ